MIRPQSMMFTLYGDYIISRSGDMWVGSLIEIAAQFGLSEQAVRSALSRMSRNGWLKVRRAGNKSFYSLTAKSQRLLQEGRSRIFQRRKGPWDGRWRILVYSIPETRRELRDQLRKQLSWLGFGPLSNGSWISPHDLRDQEENLVANLGINARVETFMAEHTGFSSDRELASRCWDLVDLSSRYRAFLDRYRPLYQEHEERLRSGDGVEDSQCFVHRFMLIHEYRKFFFIDPELPDELLPEGWLGGEAARLFESYHQLLAEKANRYFDSVFEKGRSVARIDMAVCTRQDRK